MYFRESRVKLKRALQFIDEIDAGLRAYNASNPISVTFGPSGTMNFNLKKIDPTVHAALGDAVHNMRAALDLMASELARINGKSDKNVYFPFAASKEKLPDQIDSKHFDRTGDDAVALLGQFEPYLNGNKKLRAIHDLDIRDKHSSMIVTRYTINNLNFSYKLDEGPNQIIAANASFTHEFLDSPLTGLPLVETMKEFVQIVDGIIEEFARMVEQRGTNSATEGERPATR